MSNLAYRCKPTELALMVLGYLREQNAMISYDEFLKFSPHLMEERKEKSVLSFSPFMLRDLVNDYYQCHEFLFEDTPTPLSLKLMKYKTLLEKMKYLFECTKTYDLSICRHKFNNNSVSQHNCSDVNVSNDVIIHPAEQLVQTTKLSDLPGMVNHVNNHSIKEDSVLSCYYDNTVTTSYPEADTIKESHSQNNINSLIDGNDVLVKGTMNISNNILCNDQQQYKHTNTIDLSNAVQSEFTTQHTILRPTSSEEVIQINNTMGEFVMTNKDKAMSENKIDPVEKIPNNKKKIKIISDKMIKPATVGPPVSQKFTANEIMSMPVLFPVSKPVTAVVNPQQSESKSFHHVEAEVSPTTNDYEESETINKTAGVSMSCSAAVTETVSTPVSRAPAPRSSSTPRRTSHIRVLDFTTPGRPLHLVPEATSNATTVLLTSTTDTIVIAENKSNTETTVTSCQKTIQTPTQAQKSDKRHWDTDLRAMLSDETLEVSKKAKIPSNKMIEKTNDQESKSCKKTVKKKTEVNKNVNMKTTKSPNDIKPKFRIVTSEKTRVESEENNVELNLSDLLDTPLKTAMMDFQMNTPRLLETLNEPHSDIKFTNIPTPGNFSLTPFESILAGKGITPPSYNTRPTDYSSGSSYYKPDEQEYGQMPQISPQFNKSLDTSQKEPKSANSKSKKTPRTSTSNDDTARRNPRPLRQCTMKFRQSISKVTKQVMPKNKEMTRDSSSDSDSENNNETIKSNLLSKPHIYLNEADIKADLDVKKRRVIEKLRKSSPQKKTKLIKTTYKISATKNNSKKGSTSKSVKNKTKVVNKSVVVSESPNKENAVPTKSRRKSSTPRKIANITSQAEPVANKSVIDKVEHEDSLPPLHLSSDESSAKSKHSLPQPVETDFISQIKEYIDNTNEESVPEIEKFKEEFNPEDAKKIERDLLGTPTKKPDHISSPQHNNTKPNPEEKEEDTIELGVSHCCEDDDHFITLYSACDLEIDCPTDKNSAMDNYKVGVQICEEAAVQYIQATPLVTNFEMELEESDYRFNNIKMDREIECAVQSISDVERLYTPIKDMSYSRKCQELFDSTLTSIDTPLKEAETPLVRTKRKLSSENALENDTKKCKQVDPQILLNQVGIESVLSKLHGPNSKI